MKSLSVHERAALLRAARKQMDTINEEIIRLHAIDGTAGQEQFNRKMADAQSEELTYLAGAVRKLWLSTGDLD